VSGRRSSGRRLGVVGIEEVLVGEDGRGGGWEVCRELEVEEDLSHDAGFREQSEDDHGVVASRAVEGIEEEDTL
jgi:hypothetical protein